MKKEGKVRVRLAPSPTGPLHIGTARTGLFNWLFAKKHGGIFVLRIEDTDRERSKKEYETDIIEGLKWLGIESDENPVRQSERSHIYKGYIEKLLEEKKAYRCFCSKEDLQKEREIAIKKGRVYVYSGVCRKLKEGTIQKNISEGRSSIIRLRIKEEKITLKDSIRGHISFDMKLIGDFVIARDEETPLYNLAVVIDDEKMDITHVIRGEDHITNTPKQIVIRKALGIFSESKLEYAHLPLLLNPDRSKMSKRVQATSVGEYRAQGHLPEALFNFIALLGWHPKHGKEILSKKEIENAFDLGDVQKGGAIFDIKKLEWMSGEYYQATPNDKLAKLLDLKPTPLHLVIIEQLKHRKGFFKKGDVEEMLKYTKQPDYDARLLQWKNMSKSETLGSLIDIQDILVSTSEDEMKNNDFETILEKLVEEKGKGPVFWPLRIALSGEKTSPSADEIKELNSKDKIISSIQAAITKLEDD